eukprot:9599588-Lingulodinium_polyedra.AAC.1
MTVNAPFEAAARVARRVAGLNLPLKLAANVIRGNVLAMALYGTEAAPPAQRPLQKLRSAIVVAFLPAHASN